MCCVSGRKQVQYGYIVHHPTSKKDTKVIHLSHDAGEDTVLIVFVPAMINALLLDSIKTGNDIK